MFAKGMRTQTEDISMSWIIEEFCINELEDIEQQKQLLVMYMDKSVE